MALFSDDFTQDTVDEYAISQSGSRAGAGDVSWDVDGEQLFVYAPNNVTVSLSRDDVTFPASGRVRMEFVVHRDYHVTDKIGVRWRQDDDNWLEWRGTGDGSGSSFASSYGNSVRAVVDGETVVNERVTGTVGPSSEVRTLEAYWTPTSMSVAIDGETEVSAEVDVAAISPSTFEFFVNQGDVDLKSIEMSGSGGSSIVVRQGGESFEIEPLSYRERSIEAFYSYGDPDHASSNTPTGLEQRGVSQLFVYDGPEGRSLAVIHDAPNNGNGGDVRFDFDGLPTGGDWVVEDDSGDFSRNPPVTWRWASCCTDGGAFRGGLDGDFEITITPDFQSGISEWQVLSGDAADPTRHSLDTAAPVTIGTGQPHSNRVEASVTTLQFIPGKEENPTRGGHPLNSGLMQVFPEDGRWGIWGYPLEANSDPVFDSWLGGDMIDELPETLDEALEPREDKYIDDRPPGEEFNEYRFENGVRVSFETDDGSIDKDTIEIAFSEAGPSGDDPLISRGGQSPSVSVLHDHELNGIPWREWYDNDNVRPSRREPRHYEYDTDFEFEGVEGVRVVTCWGGWVGFMRDILARAAADAPGFLGEIWDWGFGRQALLKLAMMSAPEKVDFFLEAITTIPRTWTFLDFIVLADGRRYARIWDASQYPSLSTFVDGELKGKEDMPYDTKQTWNKMMFALYVRAIAGATPYSNPLKYYELSLTSDPLFEHIERGINEMIDNLDLGWVAAELMPTIPRETLGFDGDASATDTEPIGDPDGPFPPLEGLFFPRAAKLPSE